MQMLVRNDCGKNSGSESSRLGPFWMPDQQTHSFRELPLACSRNSSSLSSWLEQKFLSQPVIYQKQLKLMLADTSTKGIF